MIPAFQARPVNHTRWLEALHARAEVRLPGKRTGRGQEGSDATLSQKVYFLTQPFNLKTYPTVFRHMPLSSAPGPALPAAACLRQRCLFIISFWPLTASPSFPTSLPKPTLTRCGLSDESLHRASLFIFPTKIEQSAWYSAKETPIHRNRRLCDH